MVWGELNQWGGSYRKDPTPIATFPSFLAGKLALDLTLLVPGDSDNPTKMSLEVLRIQVNVGSFNPSKYLFHVEKKIATCWNR